MPYVKRTGKAGCGNLRQIYGAFEKNDTSGTIASNMVSRLTTNYTYFMREQVPF